MFKLGHKKRLRVCVLGICVEKTDWTGLGNARRLAVHVLMDVRGHKWKKERGS